MPNGQLMSLWSATAFSQVFGESAACMPAGLLYRTIFSAADRHGKSTPCSEGRERYLKSGGGRRFLRRQLRYYLEKLEIAAQLSEAKRDAACTATCPESFRGLRGYP